MIVMQNIYSRKSNSFLLLFFISFISFLLPVRLFAQDTIIGKDSSVIAAKVVEITSGDIKYRKFSNQEGPLYSINKNDVIKVLYENGEIEYFKTSGESGIVNSNATPAIDSLKYIEDVLGLKLANSDANGGCIKIVDLYPNSVFEKQKERVLVFSICYVITCDRIRVRTISELCKTVFDLYKEGYTILNFGGVAKAEMLGLFSSEQRTFDFSTLQSVPGVSDKPIRKMSADEATAYARCMTKNNLNPTPLGISIRFFSGFLFGYGGAFYSTMISLLIKPKVPPYVIEQANNLENCSNESSSGSGSNTIATTTVANGPVSQAYVKGYSKQHKRDNTKITAITSVTGAGIFCLLYLIFISVVC